MLRDGLTVRPAGCQHVLGIHAEINAPNSIASTGIRATMAIDCCVRLFWQLARTDTCNTGPLPRSCGSRLTRKIQSPGTVPPVEFTERGSQRQGRHSGLFLCPYVTDSLNFRFAKTPGAVHLPSMKKLFLLLLTGMVLSSCNTTIGFGRDLRDGYHWTKGKIQESQNSGGSYDPGPPVY